MRDRPGSAAWRARGALLKGIVMAAFGLGVLADVARKLAGGLVPSAELMGTVGLVALAANLSCLILLARRRAGDLNMRSAWVCSRNDVAANVGVLLAAMAVAVTGSAWPDILMGLLIATLFGVSAVSVIRAARRELAAAPPPALLSTPGV